MDGAQLMLCACVDALETFSYTQPSFVVRNFCFVWRHTNFNQLFTDRCSLLGYDLPRNASLWELKLTVLSLSAALGSHTQTTTSSSIMAVLLSIKLPAFSKILVVYRESDFYNSVYPKDAPVAFEGEAI